MQNTSSKHNYIESQGQNSIEFCKIATLSKKNLLKSCLKNLFTRI